MSYADNSYYCVQVLVTGKHENAVHIYKELRTHKDARIEKINNTYAVRVGAHRNRVKADRLLKELKNTYSDAFVKTYTIDSKAIVRKNMLAGQKKEKKTPAIPPKRQEVKHENKQQQSPPAPPAPLNDSKQETAKASATGGEDYFKTGMKYFHERKFDSAVSYLSQYISLSPGGDQHATAFLVIGKSFQEINRSRSALRIFGRIMEKYPATPEATLSIIAMADIGVSDRALKYPIGMKGAEYFRDPVFAYDTVSVKNIPVQMTEHIQYQKGRFLWKTGRYKESWDVYTTFLKESPNSAYRKDIMVILKAGTVALIDQYNRSGDHIAAVNLFFQATEKGVIGTEDMDTMLKAALSLAHMGFFDVSSNLLIKLKAKKADKTSVDIDKALADIEKMKIACNPGQLAMDTRWNVFQSGREYLRSNNLPLAEKMLTPLKNAGGEAFWPKITEYALEDTQWRNKYRGSLNEK